MPAFFLPHCPPDYQEDSYAQLAVSCGRSVPPIGRRIYSISFEREGILWTATVGERLKGQKLVKEGAEWHIDDSALVLAIFPKVPYCILTYTQVKSHFRSIFYATPKAVELFSSS